MFWSDPTARPADTALSSHALVVRTPPRSVERDYEPAYGAPTRPHGRPRRLLLRKRGQADSGGRGSRGAVGLTAGIAGRQFNTIGEPAA